MKTTGLVLNPELSVGLEPDATSLIDLSRFKNHGTFFADGKPDWVRANGKEGDPWVMSFNGVDAQVTIPHSPSSNIIGPVTMEAWVMILADENGGLIDKNYALGGYMLWIENLASGFHTYVNGGEQARSSLSISGNIWYHLIGIVDGVNNQLYQNGIVQTHVQNDLPTGNTSDLTLGTDIGGRFPKCLMAPPIIWRRALSAGQALKRFEATRSRFGV